MRFVICCCLCRKYLWFPGFCGFFVAAAAERATCCRTFFHLALTPTHTHTYREHSMAQTDTHSSHVATCCTRALYFALSFLHSLCLCKVFFFFFLVGKCKILICWFTALTLHWKIQLHTHSHTHSCTWHLYGHLFSCRLKVCYVIFSSITHTHFTGVLCNAFLIMLFLCVCGIVPHIPTRMIIV